jgi:hypothetical protein
LPRMRVIPHIVSDDQRFTEGAVRIYG